MFLVSVFYFLFLFSFCVIYSFFTPIFHFMLNVHFVTVMFITVDLVPAKLSKFHGGKYFL